MAEQGTRTTLRSRRPTPPVPPPKPSVQGRCAYCGRPTTRYILNVWACSWCDDLPGKEAL